MAEIIRIWNYGNYSTDNYGSSRAVQIGSLTLYFSYETIIAFEDGGDFHIIKNYWSSTTGKHLNAISPDKKEREEQKQFQVNLELALEKHNLKIKD